MIVPDFSKLARRLASLDVHRDLVDVQFVQKSD